MTDEEIRANLAQAMLGASIALGLMIDGLRGRVEPKSLSIEENVMLHKVLHSVHKAGEALAAMGGAVRGGPGR